MPDPNIRQYYTGGASRTDVDSGFPTIHPLTARDQLMALIDRESAQPRMEPPFRAAAMPRGGDVGRPMAPRLPSGQASMTRGGGGEPTGAAPIPTGTIRNPASVTPRQLGRFQMNHTGNWGTMVDPADIPAGLQDQIMGGFYGLSTNWDSSNPSIMGPQQWRTGKYTHSGGVSMPQELRQQEGGGQQSSNKGFDYLTPLDQARYLAALQR